MNRQAALAVPVSKREYAFIEVLLAELLERMMRNSQAVPEFEDLRFHVARTTDRLKHDQIFNRMTEILKDEIVRTMPHTTRPPAWI